MVPRLLTLLQCPWAGRPRPSPAVQRSLDSPNKFAPKSDEPKISALFIRAITSTMTTSSGAFLLALLLVCAYGVEAWRTPAARAHQRSVGRVLRPPSATSMVAYGIPKRAEPAVAPAPQPPQLYTSPEMPKPLGGLRIGARKLVVLTGASSGLGLACLKALLKEKDYFVVCAVRDPVKMRSVAMDEGLDMSAIEIMKLELGSLKSVRDFVQNLRLFKVTRALDFLICNAAVYLPTDPKPRFTDDGLEQSLGINHVGHFLLCRLLLDDLKRAKDPRCIIVGSITGNTNTIGGGLVYPRADLGTLRGLKRAAKGERNVPMVDGSNFFGAKAYKDSKVCNMMTAYELHKRYHEDTGIVFSTMYPGCIAETALFREKRSWFRTIFPLFMKYVTGGYVSEEEAGERLAQVSLVPAAPRSAAEPDRPRGPCSASRIRGARSPAFTGAGTATHSSWASGWTPRAGPSEQVRAADCAIRARSFASLGLCRRGLRRRPL